MLVWIVRSYMNRLHVKKKIGVEVLFNLLHYFYHRIQCDNINNFVHGEAFEWQHEIYRFKVCKVKDTLKNIKIFILLIEHYVSWALCFLRTINLPKWQPYNKRGAQYSTVCPREKETKIQAQTSWIRLIDLHNNCLLF